MRFASPHPRSVKPRTITKDASIVMHASCLCFTSIVAPPNVAEANQSPKERDKPADESTGWVKWSVAHEQLKHETRAYACA